MFWMVLTVFNYGFSFSFLSGSFPLGSFVFLSLKCFGVPPTAIGVLRKPSFDFPFRFGSFLTLFSFSFGSFLGSFSIDSFPFFFFGPVDSSHH